MKNKPLTICDLEIQPGEKITLALPTPELYTCVRTHIPIHVLHGKKAGGVLLVCAAMHENEMNGIGIIEKLLNLNMLKSLTGTLIAIPVMNIYGLISQSHALSDRKDLKNAFPGNETGSFAERLANLLTKKIFSLATHCIDLHSGEPYSEKFPQIHTALNLEEAKKMALAFQAPIVIDTNEKRGLLWLSHQEKSVPTIIFDTGEPLRLDRDGMNSGVKGIVRVLRQLNMLPSPPTLGKSEESIIVQSVQKIYSPCSGLCRFYKELGHKVKKGALIAHISDPFGAKKREDIISPFNGLIISKSTLPIVNEGDSIVQIAEIDFPTNAIEKEETLPITTIL